MLDIRLIREQPETVKQGLTLRGADSGIIDQILHIDETRRRLETEMGELRARRNAGSKQIGAMPDAEAREALKTEMRELGDAIGLRDAALNEAAAQQHELMLNVPNLPHPDVPRGQDDSENVELRAEGAPPEFSFTPKPHWELGASLGILDMERGVKLSGSRFYVLKGQGARLQRALITLFLDMHVEQHGYTEVYPPALVREKCLVGTGNLPKFADNLYHDVEEDYWLIPTAEVPVTNLHADEILADADLPVKYVAYSPCFRREKMAAGRDVRGIKRGHQFDKVEMVKLTKPDNSDAELVSLLDNAEQVCRTLGLPYRVLRNCTGDLTFSSATTYDVEVWAAACGDPEGSGTWLEVSSCSNFGDFQARRANIRYRPAAGGKPEFVHTLNGSGLALPRVVIAVLENNQNADGSVTIPQALRPYMGGRDRIVGACA